METGDGTEHRWARRTGRTHTRSAGGHARPSTRRKCLRWDWCARLHTLGIRGSYESAGGSGPDRMSRALIGSSFAYFAVKSFEKISEALSCAMRYASIFGTNTTRSFSRKLTIEHNAVAPMFAEICPSPAFTSSLVKNIFPRIEKTPLGELNLSSQPHRSRLSRSAQVKCPCQIKFCQIP